MPNVRPVEPDHEPDLRKEFDQIKDDLIKMRKHLDQLVTSLKTAGGERMHAFSDEVTDFGKGLVETSEKRIKERPLISVLVMLVIGVLLGALLNRNQKHG